MKKDEAAKKNALIGQKMTLRDYYKSLPEATQVAPKKELIERIALRCEIPAATVRSWFAYGHRPRYKAFLQILSEETGIPMENLFAN